MNPLDDLEAEPNPQDADTVLFREVAAAVDFLRRGARPGITVWDVVEEALRWSVGTQRNWDSFDPLADAMRASLSTSTPAPLILSSALDRWVTAQAAVLNDGQPWCEPPAQ